MIEFCPGRYYVAMWYLDVPHGLMPPNGGNLLACLWREDDTDEWTLQWRFRYYEHLNEPLTAKSKDKFSWYEAKAKSEQYAIDGLNQIFNVAGAVAGNRPDVFWIRGDVDHVFKLINSPAKPSWFNKVEEVKT